MRADTTNHDPQALALQALAWCLEDAPRAARLLDLTGLTINDLRAQAAEPSLQAAVLGFLEAHEPDLIAAADALQVTPIDLVKARAELDG